jgi:CheY-like chemotaxis protein
LAEPQAAVNGSAIARARSGELAKRRPRLLVVEDEAIAALMMEQTLIALGYEVCDVVDSEAGALEAAEKHCPDLILMDIRLAGGGDGIRAAAKARDRLSIPSIFTTAHSDAATLARAEGAKPVGFLLKPYSRAQVRDALAHAIDLIREG